MRDLGVPYDGTPGPLNAITDVAGVEVGVTTLIEGEPKDPDGTRPWGPARARQHVVSAETALARRPLTS